MSTSPTSPRTTPQRPSRPAPPPDPADALPRAAVLRDAWVAQGWDDGHLDAWLQQHKDGMFRWALQHLADPLDPQGLDLRRSFARAAVAMQRQQGPGRFSAWLFRALLTITLRQARQGAASEAMLAGLPPELRAMLRLVAHGDWSPQTAWALLPEPMTTVRRQLLRTRLPASH